ncbi:GNAT family N-acetyltransferase [Aliiruegeria sabulilitoris]|uniref:GNAT family N-acetyltransferase n=1 Tax=Aliiruegeria sabulilitoris TaxID=1510458 RepID=UPI00083266E0|nr:GNAT family N-acetyltransferase [Aliiruegeria sabulilitoris]NDR59388.1 GNAT family N-acetyltransferase [Pseudoruegeria sp. M32A2M]
MTAFSVPLIETERLRLRGPQIADYDAFADFLASPRAAFIGGPITDPMALSRVFGHAAGMWMLRGFGTFIFERKSDGTAIGHGGPWQPMPWPEPELGWCIWRDADEGMGYVTEALDVIRDWAFATLGWQSCVSYIDAGNHRSAAVARRLGAVRDENAALPPGEAPAELHVYRHVKGGA